MKYYVLNVKGKEIVVAQDTDGKFIIPEFMRGLGTSGLKPSTEEWILVRKPISEKTVAANVLAHGTGGINIDASRIGYSNKEPNLRQDNGNWENQFLDKSIWGSGKAERKPPDTQGRFPANLILSHNDDCVEESVGRIRDKEVINKSCTPGCAVAALDIQAKQEVSRFFYVSKASKADKNNNCEDLLTWEERDQNLQDRMAALNSLLKVISEDIVQNLNDTVWNTILSGSNTTEKFQKDFKSIMSIILRQITESKTSNVLALSNTNESILGVIRMIETSGLNLVEAADFTKKYPSISTNEEMGIAMSVSGALLQELSEIRKLAKQGNIHATVKSTTLMSYLIKLITPPNGIVLDPFMGSGSTGVAALKEGFDFIGIEKEPEYYEIADKRIAA